MLVHGMEITTRFLLSVHTKMLTGYWRETGILSQSMYSKLNLSKVMTASGSGANVSEKDSKKGAVLITASFLLYVLIK